MSEEIKNVTEETMGVEETVKESFFTKVGAAAKKHKKKIIAGGLAVVGVGVLIAKALCKGGTDDGYETTYDDEVEDDFEEVTDETIE